MDNTYCVAERKYTGNIDPKIFKTRNGRFVVKSMCPSCKHKKSKFVKRQEACGILKSLGLNTGDHNKIPILGDILF